MVYVVDDVVVVLDAVVVVVAEQRPHPASRCSDTDDLG